MSEKPVDFKGNYIDTRNEHLEQLLELSVETFVEAGDWGVRGAIDRYDAVYNAWKSLTEKGFRTFSKERLKLRGDETQIMMLLGQRRAKAVAMLRNFSASAELFATSQSEDAFEQFITFAEEWDAYSGDRLDRVVAHSYRWASSRAANLRRRAETQSQQ